MQVSGISTEIFKQIETVENDHDASTAAALEAVERRGEMVVRVIEPRQMGRQASEAAKKFIVMQVRCRWAVCFRQIAIHLRWNVISCHKLVPRAILSFNGQHINPLSYIYISLCFSV